MLPKNYCFDRIAIEAVSPEIDNGHFNVKRVVGDTLEVFANIFTEGHQAIKAALVYTSPCGASEEIPMLHQGNDHWSGIITLNQIGVGTYTIKAWHDMFGHWLSDARKKLKAGEDITLDLIEGRQWIEKLLKLKSAAHKNIMAQVEKLWHEDSAILLDALAIDEITDLFDRYAVRPDEVTYEKISKSQSTASALNSAHGMNSFRAVWALRPPAVLLRIVNSACLTSRKWVLTLFIFRRSIRSAARSARARITA